MSFITRFFSLILSRREKSGLRIDLGKYIEQSINQADREKWNRAVELYTQGKYLESYDNLLQFLKDPNLDNIIIKRENHLLEFELFQGSKKVIGRLTDNEITVFSDVVGYKEHIPQELLEVLLQENYKFRYARFVLTSQTIRMFFNGPVSLVPPNVFYQALKELSITADSYDDVLIEQYKDFTPINTQHIVQLPEKEVNIKIKYFRQWLKSALGTSEKIGRDKRQKEANKGTISYILLSTAYKIFYLLAPEGVLLDYLKRLDSFYWSNNLDVVNKNEYLISSFSELLSWTDQMIARSLYKVISTFSTVQSIGSHKLIDFISTELEAARQYVVQGYSEFFHVVVEYIVGYVNFHIALKPDYKELLDILWRLYNDDYFLDLGFSVRYITRGKLNSFVIEYRLNKVLDKYKLRGKFKVSKLDYSSLQQFSQSFLNEFVNLLSYDK